LRALAERAMATTSQPVNSDDEANRQSEEMQALSAELEAISERVTVLEQQTLTPLALVLHSDALDVTALKTQRDNVSSTLVSGQSEVSTRRILVQLTTVITTTTTTVRHSLTDASAAEDSIDVDEMSAAIDSLESTVRPQLDSLQSAYDRIPEGPEGDELRSKTLDDLSQLGEWLLTLLQSLRDRRDALAEFGTLAAQVEKAVGAVHDRTRPELEQDDGESKKKKKGAAKKPPTVDQLGSRVQLFDIALADLEAVHPQIDSLRTLADSLRPAEQSLQRVDAVQAHKDDLVRRIQVRLLHYLTRA
jgi:hypothetical protein